MRLLIVDDDEMTVLCVKKWIDEMRFRQIHHIDTALSAEEALQHARTYNVDLLLTDIQMVEMNGLELIAEIKKLNSRVQTLILTAYASFAYAHRAIELGVQGFLLKPFDKTELQQAIAQAVRQYEAIDVGNPEGNDPIHWAKNYVQQHLNQEINMAFVANELNLSYTYFSKIFKQHTGMTFSMYITEVKMKEAGRMLREGYKTNEVAEKLGYLSPQNFNRAFVRYWQCTPNAYRGNKKKPK